MGTTLKNLLARLFQRSALRASHELYKSSFDEANIGLLHTSLDGRFLMGNKALAAILGFDDVSEIMGRAMASVTHPDERERDSDRLRRLAAGDTGIPTSWEKRYLRKNGDVVHARISVKVRRDDAGKPLHFLTVVQDLTDVRHANGVLKQTLDALPVSISYLDLNFKYVFTNHVYRQAFLTAQADIEAGRLQSVFDAETAKCLWTVREAAKRGEPGRISAWMTQPGTGKRMLLDFRYVPHRDDSGHVAGIIVFGEDITQQIADRDRLLDQQSRLVATAKLAALGEMAAGIAHEINNPLAIIDGKARQLRSLVRKIPQSPEKIEATIASIGTMSERIARIVRGMRTFSREGGSDPFQPTMLPAIVSDSVALCDNRFKLHGVTLIIGELPAVEIECRATEIAQVLLNFLSNSLDAVVAAAGELWVRIDAADRGDSVEISVTDAGPGIPQDLREKIMHPFFTTKAVGKGTGLGLSISKDIVEGHNGQLRLDDSSTATRFVIEIPKYQHALRLKEA